MRPLILITAIGLLLGGGAAADETRVAPDWTLRSTSGETVTLSEVAAEQPVIVLFWATWCPYCKALMPHIQSIRLEHGDGIRILAVHFRDDKGDPAAFVANAGYDFTVLPDGGEVAKLNSVWGTPGVLVVDRDRTVRFDLYKVPKQDLSEGGESQTHSRKAAFRAPYWAAELRKAVDVVLREKAE